MLDEDTLDKMFKVLSLSLTGLFGLVGYTDYAIASLAYYFLINEYETLGDFDG